MEKWDIRGNKLCKEFVFTDFLQSMERMSTCSLSIENLGHHPEWKNIYNKIEVELCTHDAGNIITEKDYALASLLDNLYSKYINS